MLCALSRAVLPPWRMRSRIPWETGMRDDIEQGVMEGGEAAASRTICSNPEAFTLAAASPQPPPVAPVIPRRTFRDLPCLTLYNFSKRTISYTAILRRGIPSSNKASVSQLPFTIYLYTVRWKNGTLLAICNPGICYNIVITEQYAVKSEKLKVKRLASCTRQCSTPCALWH